MFVPIGVGARDDDRRGSEYCHNCAVVRFTWKLFLHRFELLLLLFPGGLPLRFRIIVLLFLDGSRSVCLR
jgi:hypothetical protein